jgi:hypothetical protein
MAFLSKFRPAPSEAELFRTPQMDEEYADEAGSKLACELYMRILGIADAYKGEHSEFCRSAMVSQADSYAASYLAYHAARCYPSEKLRVKFLEGSKKGFSLLAAVGTDSMGEKEHISRPKFETLTNLVEMQYRTIRASLHSRLFRLFLGEAFVDEVFLTGRINDILGEGKASVSQSMLGRFAKRVVSEVHHAVGTFARSMPRH